MRDEDREAYEGLLTEAVAGQFDRHPNGGPRLAAGVASSAEPILRRVVEEQAAFMLLLLLAAEDDEDNEQWYSDQLSGQLAANRYATDRAATLGSQLAEAGGPYTAERAVTIGITETTAAGSEGHRQAEAATRTPPPGGRTLTVDLVWNTARDAKVCPICQPLDGTKRDRWAQVYPDGPPGHPRCRCSLAPSIVRESVRESFDEADHPRGDDGRFISKGDIAAAISDDKKAAELFARTTDPDQRRKLEKQLGKTAAAVPRRGRPMPQKTKSAIAKASAKLTDRAVQRAGKANEHKLAKQLKGTSLEDSDPHDVETNNALVEVKTVVTGENSKITMNGYAIVRKLVLSKERKKEFHTVVYDNQTKSLYYRRGVAGSARLGSLHKVTGGEKEIKRLMTLPENDLPAGAKRTDDAWRNGRWVSLKDQRGFRNVTTGKVVLPKTKKKKTT